MKVQIVNKTIVVKFRHVNKERRQKLMLPKRNLAGEVIAPGLTSKEIGHLRTDCWIYENGTRYEDAPIYVNVRLNKNDRFSRIEGRSRSLKKAIEFAAKNGLFGMDKHAVRAEFSNQMNNQVHIDWQLGSEKPVGIY